jgi:hypothetical protein
MQNVELDRVARRKTADGTGELAGVFDRLAIHRSDDIAGFDAGLGSRAVGLRFRHQRALGVLQTKAVGDIRRYRLNLDTDPAAGLEYRCDEPR